MKARSHKLSKEEKMKTKYLIVIVALIALALAACAPAPTAAPTAAPPTAASVAPVATSAPAPTAVPPTATAASKVKLNIAYSTLNPDPLPLWVAKDAGFFDKNYLDVTVIFVGGGTKTAQAPISKEGQFAATAFSGPVAATASGAHLVLVAGLVNVPNYDFVVAPKIKTAADLKAIKSRSAVCPVHPSPR